MSQEIDFNSLNIKISPLIEKYPVEQQKQIFEYLTQMDDLDRKAYEIAYNHLGTSFNITRSNGFKKWLLNSKSNTL
jgi:hypothetical protein